MKKVLRAVGAVVAGLLLMAMFYVAVVMGQPQEERPVGITPRPDQPLLAAMQNALLIDDERDLPGLLDAFPAPVLCASYGNALIFEQGLCRDVSFEGGLGRVVSLTYRTEHGDEVTVTSIYPARAVALMGKGDLTIRGEGPLLASLRSVRMENDTHIRLHAQGAEGLYTVSMPKTSSAVLRQVTAALQLAEGAVP